MFKSFNCKTTLKTFEILIQAYNDLILGPLSVGNKAAIHDSQPYILILPMGQIVNFYLVVKKDKKIPIRIEIF